MPEVILEVSLRQAFTKAVMYIDGIYLVYLNFLYLHTVYLCYIPTPTFFTHPGGTGRLVPQVRRRALPCCASAAHHVSVCLVLQNLQIG